MAEADKKPNGASSVGTGDTKGRAEKSTASAARSATGAGADAQASGGNAERMFREIGDALKVLSYQSLAAGGVGASPPAGDLGAVVELELRKVLGYRPKEGNGRAAVAALAKSFAEERTNGLPVFTWNPRSYAVLTDLSGEITGAQASLYTRASRAISEVLRLLDGLEPLIDVDEEVAEAALAVLRQGVNALLEELGRPGGPRVARVDSLFEQLLLTRKKGKPCFPNELTSRHVEGRLGFLGALYGFSVRNSYTRGDDKAFRVNTIEEERYDTDYRIVADYLVDLFHSWSAEKDNGGGMFGNPFSGFGTQLVHIERLLNVIAESVAEVRGALAAVLIGPAEQGTLELPLGESPADRMTVDDLLSWIEHFASEGGPDLLQDGGRLALEGEFTTTRRLKDLISAACTLAQATQARGDDGLPEAFRSELVAGALEQLFKQLRTLEDVIGDKYGN